LLRNINAGIVNSSTPNNVIHRSIKRATSCLLAAQLA
jgi:hypothetical protein